jgi:hypothetical protein
MLTDGRDNGLALGDEIYNAVINVIKAGSELQKFIRR